MTGWAYFLGLTLTDSLQDWEKNENQVAWGTDQELALRKALQEVFPQSNTFLCVQHLKKTLERYLHTHAHKLGMPETDRAALVHSIFSGDNSVLASNSLEEFLQRVDDVELPYRTDERWGEGGHRDYLRKMFVDLEVHVWVPTRAGFHRARADWTTNSCESMNNILKNATARTPKKTLSEMVEMMELQFAIKDAEEVRAIHGTGEVKFN
jgi:hypothetical protein